MTMTKNARVKLALIVENSHDHNNSQREEQRKVGGGGVGEEEEREGDERNGVIDRRRKTDDENRRVERRKDVTSGRPNRLSLGRLLRAVRRWRLWIIFSAILPAIFNPTAGTKYKSLPPLG